jgi:hypothetical protein
MLNVQKVKSFIGFEGETKQTEKNGIVIQRSEPQV